MVAAIALAGGASCGSPTPVATTAATTSSTEAAQPVTVAATAATTSSTTAPPVTATATATATATTTEPAPSPAIEGEVRGTVRFSPVCPVERIPPDPACAPRPGPADVELVRPDGTVAATGQAGADGAFAIPAGPGRYAVRASVPSVGGGGQGIGRGCQSDPAAVTVEPGSPITVAVSCDTGIR